MSRKNACITSIEPMILMAATAIDGSDAADWISADENDNTINALGGDDSIYAPLGNNLIDGGAGLDTLVIYEGVADDFQLSALADGSIQILG
ncbi:MAG TPA: hypothetical protein DCG12_15375, partial [Planctomycetaceae bacterium]|nr:hypothetical protein [Planctomycetaceae bacterium]